MARLPFSVVSKCNSRASKVCSGKPFEEFQRCRKTFIEKCKPRLEEFIRECGESVPRVAVESKEFRDCIGNLIEKKIG